MFGFLGADLPKRHSFYTGVEPQPPAGGWPPVPVKRLGSAAKKVYKKCLEQGGRFIGPKGKRWCQLGPAYGTNIGIQPDVAVPTPPGTLPDIPPDTDVPPSIVGPSPGDSGVDDAAVTDFLRDGGRVPPSTLLPPIGNGQVSGSITTTNGSGSGIPGWLILAAVGGVAAVWYWSKRKKRAPSA